MKDQHEGGRRAWLLAGQELLRNGGIAAVKLHALAETARLTTGSFYHHFSGMREFQSELAHYYGAEQPAAGVAWVDHPDPRERLRRFRSLGLDDRMAPLDSAMRDWAGSDADAAAAVEQADRVLLEFFAQAFHDLGFPGRAGQVRAGLLLSGGVARITTPWESSDDDFERVLDILAPTRREEEFAVESLTTQRTGG